MVKKLKWNLVLMSVLYLGLGIFLVLKPGTALNIVCYALGGVVPDLRPGVSGPGSLFAAAERCGGKRSAHRVRPVCDL